MKTAVRFTAALTIALLAGCATRPTDQPTGLLRPTPEQEAWAEQNMVRGTPLRMMPQAILPPAIDNSKLPFFPPIRHQGSLNSCGQFSPIYYTLTHMTAMARGWDAKAMGADQFRFSPKWTYNMVNGGANIGSSTYDAYAIAQRHGLATWAQFPYDKNYRQWCLNPATWRDALKYKAGTSGRVAGIDTDSGLHQLKQLLVNGYVLNVATYIQSWSWKRTTNDPSTTLDDGAAGKMIVYRVSGMSGGHSMAIVGYNDAVWVDLNGNGAPEPNEKGALRIANSWGTSWQEGGFCWVAYDALRQRNTSSYRPEGFAWYNEATWILAAPETTPKLLVEFTLNHAKRNQLRISAGVSLPSASGATTTWLPKRILYGSGGPYAFDGSTVATNGTFLFDISELVPSDGSARRYWLSVADNAAGSPAAFLSANLISNGVSVPMAPLPHTVDNATVWVSGDFSGAPPPPPPPPATDVLEVPTNQRLTEGEGHRVTLYWTDNADNETGYFVERATKTDIISPFQRVADLPANSTRFSEYLPLGYYVYRVACSNEFEMSPYAVAAIRLREGL